MWDSNLLFSNAQALVATGFSTNSLAINKTKGNGYWVEAVVSAFTGITGLTVIVYTKDVDAAWAVTDRIAGQTQATIVANGRYLFRIQSKNLFAKAYYTFTGAGSVTVTCGLVSGPLQDAMV